MLFNPEILTIVRIISALFALLGLYYSYKLFTLVKYTKYWSLGWGFFVAALITMTIRRFYTINMVPCSTNAEYYAEYQATLIPPLVAMFSIFIWGFYTKYLGIHSTSETLRNSIRDEIRDEKRDLDRDKKRDIERDVLRDKMRDKLKNKLKNNG